MVLAKEHFWRHSCLITTFLDCRTARLSIWFRALAARVLGSGIVVFGDGPDGGREATFERKLTFPSTVEGWDGYGVVQAKYRQ